jgi:pimeloyl-ACP methyl ester carboxylesterase/membrane protein DedA with SNARE-associated domain
MSSLPAGKKGGCLRIFLVVYLALLAASHIVQWLRPEKASDPGVAEGSILETIEVAERDAGQRDTGGKVTLAYREWGADLGEGAPAILMLQGSPGDGRDFDRIAPGLVERGYRGLAVDLPGFGASSREVADYSIKTHAAYCRDLLAALGLRPVDVIGFSMGSGVALHLAAAEPERVRSLVLLSGIGVQELELLGHYHLNHAIHAAQLAAFTLADHSIPHFGLVRTEGLGHSYGRNFYDTDQRPLRGLLRGYAGPMLILHGKKDMLVPYEAALEHHRLVPQSELVSFDTNHFMPFMQPDLVIGPIADFLDRVGRGQAQARAQADPQRLAEAEPLEVIRRPRASGPTLLVWMFLLAVATLVSEDLTCIAAGLLVARGSLGFLPATLACAAGIFLGDLMLYALGRLGRPAIEKGWLRFLVSDRALARSRRFFEKRGAQVIFASRFMPGTRLPAYVTAGLLAMPFWRFTLYLFLPVAAWTPLLVGISVVIGEPFFELFGRYERYATFYFVAAVLAVWLLSAFLRSLLTWRGRRLLYGKLQRQLRWEFWPPWMFYPPIFVYLIWLAIKYRGATLFTAANPGMPGGGGFVGESKSEILGRINESAVAEYRVLPAGDASRLAAVEEFQATLEAAWPVVLKPDVGQRGSGVVVARDRGQVEAFLAAEDGPAIVQRFVAGPELGIFYVRLPGESRGRIFSITHKVLTAVLGDGVSHLEKLILADRRAVFMAPTYLERFEDRLEEVPAAGEKVLLTELGTHCRGATFFDGWRYFTPELEAAVDRVAQSYEGFYFGRFDFRAPSFEHFERGEGLQVLELNGVTSEATHIYDPDNGVLAAWRTLREQWRLAFEIGDRNRQQGFAPTGLRGLVAMVLEFRRRSKGKK